MNIIYADYILNGSFDANKLRSVTEVFGNYQTAVYQYNNPYVSECINLQPIRNVYIHSSQLSKYKQVNCSTGDTVGLRSLNEALDLLIRHALLLRL